MIGTPFGLDIEALKPDLRELLRSELEADDELLWIDCPDPVGAAKSRWAALLFGLFWTAFSIYCTIGMWNQGDGFSIFGMLFVFAGVIMMATPWLEMRRAKRTAFALTRRRALIIRPFFYWGAKLRVWSYDGSVLTRAAPFYWNGNRGSLHFIRPSARPGGSRGPWFSFRSIENLREVTSLVNEISSNTHPDAAT